ncbi:MAG TPA: DedA family protein [Cellulomonas sp.]|uniref:DedA family protein n=1 Tax=Cellulomonas sp. TaxID=40001 RepID=UPI002E2FE305|nr:DedA family protein [Cellulomonas sp.]HEX5332488.1 DedA family protein [Cellulomonas sp.]
MLEHWTLALAGSPWVYVALYVFATIDGFFPPIPSESVVIGLAALAASTGEPAIAVLIPVAALGAFTGDQIAYTIGTRVDLHRVRLFRGRKGRRALEWAENALAHRGSSFILAARYIPVGRVAVNMTAGALGFPRRRFVGLTALAGLTWAAYGTAIGIGAGAWLKGHPVVAVAVGIVVGVVVGLVIDWALRRFLPAGDPPVALDQKRASQPAADAAPDSGGATAPAAAEPRPSTGS